MKHNRFFFLLIIVSLLLSACGDVTPTVTPQPDVTEVPTVEYTPIDLEAGYGLRGPWFKLYMTNPDSPLSQQGTGRVDGPLAEAINAARLSIDVAAYSITLNNVRNALLNAHARGVTVRIVMESTNMDSSDVQKLLEAAVPIVGDERQGLMHDKFMVIDRSEVWLGSINFTVSGTYDDNNNMIRIRSSKVAENYSVEFKEMFEDNMFGPDVVERTPNPSVTLDGTEWDSPVGAGGPGGGRPRSQRTGARPRPGAPPGAEARALTPTAPRSPDWPCDLGTRRPRDRPSC